MASAPELHAPRRHPPGPATPTGSVRRNVAVGRVGGAALVLGVALALVGAPVLLGVVRGPLDAVLSACGALAACVVAGGVWGAALAVRDACETAANPVPVATFESVGPA